MSTGCASTPLKNCRLRPKKDIDHFVARHRRDAATGIDDNNQFGAQPPLTG
jgi:hypothetical protein